VGFKVKPRQPLDLDAFTTLLKDVGPRIIRMERRNIVKKAISHMNVKRVKEAQGRPNVKNSDWRLDPAPVDIARLKQRIQALELYEQETEAYIVALGLPTTRVAYEDLLVAEGAILDRVLRFLGVERHNLSSPVSKVGSDDLRLTVSNFDEVAAAFRGSRYEHMLEEVLVPGAGPA